MKAFKMLAYLLLALLVLVVAVIAAGQLGLLAGSPPARLGVADGRLQPPSTTPNSVSSQATLYPDHPQLAYASMEPMRYSGDGAAALKKVAAILGTLDCTNIVQPSEDYLRAECSTRVLKFKDDVEFWLDRSAGVIHFRSASRLGRKDFGVNRARMKTIQARFRV